MKSGLVLFHEAMENYDPLKDLKEQCQLFERAATKGHEESIWILSVWRNAGIDWDVLKEAFSKTEEPLGWWFAGRLSEWNSREQFDFWKKSAEGGCGWGQVEYGGCFQHWGSEFVEEDQKVCVEWQEKAASQNNPKAMDWLGTWFRGEGGDKDKAMSYYRAAAELGWGISMDLLARMLRKGEGFAKEFSQAVIWGAKGDSYVFWILLTDAKSAFDNGALTDLDCDFNLLCYALGWGLYWYQYESWRWNNYSDEIKDFGSHCLDFYCSCVELQQKSIFTFLLCWNQTTGIKGPGQMIAKMVWEGRQDNLVKGFE
jgi:hypothetical protein